MKHKCCKLKYATQHLASACKCLRFIRKIDYQFNQLNTDFRQGDLLPLAESSGGSMKLRTRDKIIATLLASLLSSPVWAMPEGLEEKIADVMVWVVVIVIPLAAIYLFWKIHVIPEVIAEKNHHPQKHAIQVLCLLSLVFGGLLWPIAWLWAFTKPIAHKMAYGTDKHDDFFLDPDGHHANKPLDLAIVEDELMLLEEKLAGLTKHRELILSKQRNNRKEESNDA
jgi:hypothetical protein